VTEFIIFQQSVFKDCNNTALYVPKVIAYEVAREIQRPYNQLAYIGTEKLFKKNYLIDIIGHIPLFVLDAIGALKESGIMIHIFDFISSTSKPPPAERTDPFKPTMEGNIAILFITLLGGFGISVLFFCAEN